MNFKVLMKFKRKLDKGDKLKKDYSSKNRSIFDIFHAALPQSGGNNHRFIRLTSTLKWINGLQLSGVGSWHLFGVTVGRPSL